MFHLMEGPPNGGTLKSTAYACCGRMARDVAVLALLDGSSERTRVSRTRPEVGGHALPGTCAGKLGKRREKDETGAGQNADRDSRSPWRTSAGFLKDAPIEIADGLTFGVIGGCRGSCRSGLRIETIRLRVRLRPREGQ